jgi:uroporphyrinogen decarboxylase
MEAIHLVRAGLKSEGFSGTALIGFAGAPFTVACYMVEGAGSRDFAATRTLAYTRPALFDRIIDLVTTATIQYLTAQAEAGAETLMLFDSWAGVLAPRQFRRYVIEPTKRIVAALREDYPYLPIIGFARMAGLSLEDYARETGVNAVGLDTSMDLTRAMNLLPKTVAAQGNLDPLALVAGGGAMAADTHAVLSAAKGRPFIFNLGHGIVPQTPPDHVAALDELIRGS